MVVGTLALELLFVELLDEVATCDAEELMDLSP